jgi:hypothetical protein
LRNDKAVRNAIDRLGQGTLATISDFGSRQCSNTLHSIAKSGYKLDEDVLGALVVRAEAMASEFNSQNIANTLWALATMGRAPQQSLMDALVNRAEEITREFNPQGIADTLWALAWLGTATGNTRTSAVEALLQVCSRNFMWILLLCYVATLRRTSYSHVSCI